MPFPIELKYIEDTEKELGLKFPEKFKLKMLSENGGEFDTDEDNWELFPFLDKSDNTRISRTCNHIILETIEAKKWRNFPSNVIAIAANGMGDLLFLAPLKEDTSKLGDELYLWLHETGEVTKLANSILDFFDCN